MRLFVLYSIISNQIYYNLLEAYLIFIIMLNTFTDHG